MVFLNNFFNRLDEYERGRPERKRQDREDTDMLAGLSHGNPGKYEQIANSLRQQGFPWQLIPSPLQRGPKPNGHKYVSPTSPISGYEKEGNLALIKAICRAWRERWEARMGQYLYPIHRITIFYNKNSPLYLVKDLDNHT